MMSMPHGVEVHHERDEFLITDGTDDEERSEMRKFYAQEDDITEGPTSTILGPDNTDSTANQFCSARKNFLETFLHLNPSEEECK